METTLKNTPTNFSHKFKVLQLTFQVVIKMETWPVGEATRNHRNDYPEVMRPVGDISQKPLL